MCELINELNAELHKLFNVIPGYSSQKEKILELVNAIDTIVNNYYEEEEND